LPHDAFISYSHAADASLAAALESGLEKLAKPTLKLRAVDVFRDQTSLSANPGLWSGIVEHLNDSRWFLLFASPGSAASFWCEKEILWWLDNRGSKQILIVLTSGDIFWDRDSEDFDWAKTTALSSALKKRFSEEPLFVDLRWAHGQDRLTLSDSRFRGAVLDLAAPIRGIPKDQLDGDDVRQLRRNKLLARAAVTTIVLAAALAVWQAVEAVRERDIALSRQLAAQADNLRVSEPALSLLLAAQSFAAAHSTEASTALLRALKAAPLERIIEGSEPFWSLAVSEDGRSMAVGDGAAATHLVDLTNGNATTVLSAPSVSPLKAALATAISGDGRRVAAGGFDQTVSVWSAPGTVSKFPPGPNTHEGFVLGLAFSPDASVLASAGSDGRVLLHDLPTKRTVALQKSSNPEMTRVRFSPDGKQLAAGGDGGFIILYSLPAGRARSLPHNLSVASAEDLFFTNDGAQLICAFYDGWLGLFDVHSAKLTGSIDAREFRRLESMAAAGDGARIVTGHSDGSVVLWTKEGEKWQNRVLYRHSAEVKAVAFTSADTRLVTIGFDGRLFLSRPLDLPILSRERWRHAAPFEKASVSASGDALVLQTGASLTRVSAKNGTRISAAAPVPEAVSSKTDTASGSQAIATHPNGHALVRSDGKVFIASRQGNARVALPGLDAKTISTAVFSPDSRTVYTVAVKEIAAWSTTDGRAQGGKVHLDTGLFPRLSISEDGRFLAVALGNKIDFGASGRRPKSERLALFDHDLKPIADNLESIGSIDAFQDTPMFSSDGALLALNTSAGINFWDLEKIERIDEAIPMVGSHQIAGFDRRDRRLLIAEPRQGRMIELDTKPSEWAQEACRIAARSLTEAEWRRYISRELSFAPACTDGRWMPARSFATSIKTILVSGQQWLKEALSLR
jgi:WD40 repeat protein